MKRLLDTYEEATHERLRPICERWGAHAYIKVRVADVLPINDSGISDDLFRFALQSHFDFVVSDDDFSPLFAVEFDGDSHSTAVQGHRDEKKDALCSRFEFPILRINSRYLEPKYGGMDILGWFIHSWFATELMLTAQEDGYIPWDEPIDPTFVFNLPGEKGSFPLWLSGDIYDHVRQLADAKKTYDPGISCIVGRDSNGVYRAIAYARVTSDSAIYATTAMRNQSFPVDISRILEYIAIRDAYERLIDVLRGNEMALPDTEVNNIITSFRKRNERWSETAFSRGPATSEIQGHP
jgi:hypothetical protein